MKELSVEEHRLMSELSQCRETLKELRRAPLENPSGVSLVQLPVDRAIRLFSLAIPVLEAQLEASRAARKTPPYPAL